MDWNLIFSFLRRKTSSYSVYVTFITVVLVILLGSDRDYSSELSNTRHAAVSLLSNENIDLAGPSSIHRRDDYSCSADKPCSNGACCGKSGYCGYGSIYCGDGCLSNCDAHAECGNYSSPAGKTCPLNVCCSQYGFCGTTEDFCTNSCQSNCDQHPSPPAGASSDDVRNKVVGYYEAWSARRECHPFQPDGLPIDGLSHVNFAFAYISPGTYEVTPMDSATPESLFQAAADLKTFKSGNEDLQVYVSIGGWTFSNNDTDTQPLFGEIAGDAGKCQTFADNVVSFLDEYGFDGVDLDWEYPGAPDRGGNPEDTQNYVSLLQTLRDTFNGRPRQLGLTFTVPTSYWYLRWFSVPDMLKYADWVNLMAYDLHGFWDRDNPIGSIVQGHTNLTEIKLAVELLWRVGVAPGKVVLGTGLYGRSFQLADPSCTTPGCPFSGSANPGPCTATSGILGYFEIQDLLNGATSNTTAKRDAAPVTPIYDETDAVNYFTFDENQWVSYDDNKTFGQKVDWANSIGLGGLMVWASDLDDSQFTGIQGLLGRPIGNLSEFNNGKAVAQDWSGQNGQDCFRQQDCVDPKNPQASSCGTGFIKVGYDEGGCGGGHQKPICCPVTAAPRSCTWRGGGSDCNGQCHSGEITLFASSWGTGGKCRRGFKVFCCVSDHWNDLIKDCSFAGCGKNCDPGYDAVTYKNDYDFCQYPSGGSGPTSRNYCCKSPAKFQNCHWIGKGDCADNSCHVEDVELLTDAYGDSSHSCHWGRQRVCCCNAPSQEPYFLPVPLEDLFPTTPPAEDFVKFDLQNPHDGSSASDPNNGAFAFVLIDGPQNAVASGKTKRDGSQSDLRFIDCHKVNGTQRQTIRYICGNRGPDSDCEDMMLGGIEGTILEMPDNCGPGQWAVVHAIQPSQDQSIPVQLRRRALEGNGTVMDLTFDYDFSLIRRDSGDIYLRIDYSNVNGYWNTIVNSPHKRSISPRFWSESSGDWGPKLDTARGGSTYTVLQKDIKQTLFSTTIDCSTAAYADIEMTGSVTGKGQYGFTLVGKVNGGLNGGPQITEAYSFIKTDIDLNANLDLSLFGALSLPYTVEDLFTTAITADEFSHPGIISISPTLSVEVGFTADIEVSANFSTGFHAHTDGYLDQTIPSSVKPATGNLKLDTISNAYAGQVYDGSAGTLKLDFQPHLGLRIVLDRYGTDGKVMDAAMEGNFDAYNALQIDNQKGYQVQMGADSAIGDFNYKEGGSTTLPGWDDDAGQSRKIGDSIGGRLLYSAKAGDEDDAKKHEGGPSGHSISNDPAAIFGAFKDLLACPQNLGGGNDTGPADCAEIDLCTEFPDLCTDDDATADPEDDPNLDKREFDGSNLHKSLSKRAGPRDFQVFPRSGPRNTPLTVFKSRAYPSRGKAFSSSLSQRLFLSATFGYDIASDCSITTIAKFGLDLTAVGARSWQAIVKNTNVVTEHIYELQSVVGFLNSLIGYPLPSGAMQPVGFTVTEAFIRSVWTNAVLPNTIPPLVSGQFLVPADRIMEAMGSIANPKNFVLLSEGVNSIKAKIWKLISPISSDIFTQLVKDAIQGNRIAAEKFLSVLRAIPATFNYINLEDVRSRLMDTYSDVFEQLQLIQTNTAQFPGGGQLANAWYMYSRDLFDAVSNHARTWFTDALAEAIGLYQQFGNSFDPKNQADLQVLRNLQNAIEDIFMPSLGPPPPPPKS